MTGPIDGETYARLLREAVEEEYPTTPADVARVSANGEIGDLPVDIGYHLERHLAGDRKRPIVISYPEEGAFGQRGQLDPDLANFSLIAIPDGPDAYKIIGLEKTRYPLSDHPYKEALLREFGVVPANILFSGIVSYPERRAASMVFTHVPLPHLISVSQDPVLETEAYHEQQRQYAKQYLGGPTARVRQLFKVT